MSIHNEAKILKQPVFDDEGNFQEWQEFSPKISAKYVMVPSPDPDIADERLEGVLEYFYKSTDYSWKESSGGSTNRYFPCVYMGAGNAVIAMSAAADHSVTMSSTNELDFLILGLPAGVSLKYSLRLLTEEKTSDTAASDFAQRLVAADRYIVTLQNFGAGAIAHVKTAGPGVSQILLDADASLTKRNVVGAILTAYTNDY